MKTIKLKTNGTGRYDDVSPFIVTDNSLQVAAVLPPFNGEFYLVAENNGTVQKKLLTRDGAVTIENLSAGELNAEVKHYLKGELVKVYKVEPLILKEVDGTLSAMPEIEALHHDISSLERAFGEYGQIAAEREREREEAFEARLKDIETNLLALVRFAYKDYRDNVYLGGGTFGQFLDGFGFKLTDEQIKTIKGEKENDED